MTKTQPNIVHEAESQRQHVRVDLPAQVEIDGKLFEADNWSTGGVNIKVKDKAGLSAFKANHVYAATLIFNLDSYELRVPMSIEVRHISEDDLLIGARFDKMSARQISIMQHLVGAYVTGDLVEVNDMIHIVGRNNMTTERKIPKRENDGIVGKVKGTFQRMLVPGLSLLLLLYVITSIYEQNYIISAQSAVVTGNTVALGAPSSGNVSYKDIKPGQKVAKGEVLLSVLSAGGVVSGVDSTCDCLVEQFLVDSGDIVKTGQQLVKLVPQDTPLFVKARVSYDDAIRLSKGEKAYILHKGSGLQISAIITSVNYKGGEAAASSLIMLEPAEELSPELIGSPVEVKIDTLGLTR
ncbi:MAG: HlyD family efflux transporter periplasmic adaptor subunit [Rhodospirillales bacterium]|nr:HlyD family efflux transporter periplasmic adaptor subunit [Rhodospirillales bacterium]